MLTGHPPPAAKKHLRIMKVKRNRKNKGKPYEAKEALEGVEQEKEADLTDEVSLLCLVMA